MIGTAAKAGESVGSCWPSSGDGTVTTAATRQAPPMLLARPLVPDDGPGGLHKIKFKIFKYNNEAKASFAKSAG